MDEARDLYEEAITIAVEASDPYLEGVWALKAAGLHRLVGELSVARRRAEEGIALVREISPKALGHGLCEIGHIALASEASAGTEIVDARRIADETRAGPSSELGRGIAALERAENAFKEGRPLICGACPDAFSPGELEWLRTNRPHAIPLDMMRDWSLSVQP